MVKVVDNQVVGNQMIGTQVMLTVMDKIGFSCYSTIQVLELVDLGDTYNLITDNGDVFLEKDRCVVTDHSIEYEGNGLSVWLEWVEDTNKDTNKSTLRCA